MAHSVARNAALCRAATGPSVYEADCDHFRRAVVLVCVLAAATQMIWKSGLL
ncbi:hypothetical protein ACFPTO_00895 [Paraburkholderia denitrificans]|uniref:Uncharacterized protein n=1 Tax=Paraburkholderia denitrificans TaxID=694025 RepID=A0ABW0J2W7_9BURK